MARKPDGVFEGIDRSGAKRSVAIFKEGRTCVMVDDRERLHLVPPGIAKRGRDGLTEQATDVFGLKDLTFRPVQRH